MKWIAIYDEQSRAEADKMKVCYGQDIYDEYNKPMNFKRRDKSTAKASSTKKLIINEEHK